MPQNSNDKKYSKKGITPDKIIAFFESKLGKSQRQIGKQFGVDQKTISRWTGEIEEYIKQSPEYQQSPPKIAAMIPKALSVYANKLELDDLNAARDVLKMAAIFVERKQIEKSDAHSSNDDLWDELGGLIASQSVESGDSEGESHSPGTETQST